MLYTSHNLRLFSPAFYFTFSLAHEHLHESAPHAPGSHYRYGVACAVASGEQWIRRG